MAEIGEDAGTGGGCLHCGRPLSSQDSVKSDGAHEVCNACSIDEIEGDIR